MPSETLTTASDLKHRIRRGASGTALAQVLGQLLQMVVLAALYRLLSPSEFGLFWKVVPVVLLLRIFATLGLNVATVQSAERPSPGQLSALFWLTLASGALSSLVTAALAPFLAESDPRLFQIVLAMSGINLLVALAAQHQALVERGLRLAELSFARLGTQLLGGIAAIVAAWQGLGVWSLVIQWYVDYAATVLVCWWLEPWRPSLRFTWRDARPLLSFAGYFSGASAMFALAQNADKLAIGYLLPPDEAARALGYYSQAFSWMMKPVALVSIPLTSVLLPSLARARHDLVLYRDVLLGFSRLVAIILIPAGLGLAIVAPEAMLLIAGSNWTEAGKLLRILALTITVQGFINAAGPILASAGQMRALFVSSIAIAVALALVYLGALLVGREFDQPGRAVAIGYTLAVLVLFGPYLYFCLRLTGLRPSDWFAQLAPILGASLSMAAGVLVARHLLLNRFQATPLAALAIEVPLGVALMALFARGQVRWFLGQLRTLAESV